LLSSNTAFKLVAHGRPRQTKLVGCAPIEIPVAIVDASRVSAGVKPNVSARTEAPGEGLRCKSEMTKSARAPRNGVRAGSATAKTRITSGRFPVSFVVRAVRNTRFRSKAWMAGTSPAMT
jgi:hypothetical protein